MAREGLCKPSVAPIADFGRNMVLVFEEALLGNELVNGQANTFFDMVTRKKEYFQ